MIGNQAEMMSIVVRLNRSQYQARIPDMANILQTPYIDFETEEYLDALQEDEANLKGRLKILRKLEKNYGPYTGLDGLQTAQSLDGSYFRTLDPKHLAGTGGRDRDQVIYKWFEGRSLINRTEAPRWLWVVSYTDSSEQTQRFRNGL